MFQEFKFMVVNSVNCSEKSKEYSFDDVNVQMYLDGRKSCRFQVGKPLFPCSKKTGQFFCCGACEPKPAIVRAKLFLWYWELMVVCGGSCLCVTGGWGSTSLDSAS